VKRRLHGRQRRPEGSHRTRKTGVRHHARLQIQVRRKAIRSDLEDPGLPRVAVEHVDSAPGVLAGREQDGAVAARAVVRTKGDVRAQDGARFAKEVLEILPSNAVGQLDEGRKRVELDVCAVTEEQKKMMGAEGCRE
jgi:hypothetical protein